VTFAIENAITNAATVSLPDSTGGACSGARQTGDFAAMCASHFSSSVSDNAVPSPAAPVASCLQQLCGKVAKSGTPSAKESANQASAQLPVLAFLLPPPVTSEAVQAQPTENLSTTSSLHPLNQCAPSPSGDVSNSQPLVSLSLMRAGFSFGAGSEVEAAQLVSMGATGVHANEQLEGDPSSPTELTLLTAASVAAVSSHQATSKASSPVQVQHGAEVIPPGEPSPSDALIPQAPPLSFTKVSIAGPKPDALKEGDLAAPLGMQTTSAATDSTDAASSFSTNLSPISSSSTPASAASPSLLDENLSTNEQAQNSAQANLIRLATQSFASVVNPQPADFRSTAQPTVSAVAPNSTGKPSLAPAGEFLNALETSISATLNLLSSQLRQNNIATTAAAGAHTSTPAASPGAVSGTLSASATQSWAGVGPGAGPAGAKTNPAPSQSSNPAPPSSSAPSPTSDKASPGSESTVNAGDQNPHKNSSAVPAGAPAAQAALPQTPAAPAPAAGTGSPAVPPNTSLPMPSASANNPDTGSPAGTTNLPQNAVTTTESPANPAASPVQMAQIVSKTAQSEMRIEMNTTAFGGVEVRTTVHANDVGVVIGSERGDLRSLLSTELPGIAQSLQQQNLRLNQVNFHQSFAFSNNLSSGTNSQPRSFASKSAAVAPLASGETSDGEPLEATEVPQARTNERHLSIHV